MSKKQRETIKKALKSYHCLFKEKNDSMVVKDIKISHKIKNKG